VNNSINYNNNKNNKGATVSGGGRDIIVGSRYSLFKHDIVDMIAMYEACGYY
jgi:hypothetical protein